MPAIAADGKPRAQVPAARVGGDPLRTGVPDRVHRYLDGRMPSGNGSQFGFLLGGDVDARALRERLDRLADAIPALRAGLPPWPATRWREVPGHRIPLVEERRDEPLGPWFSRWFGAPFRPSTAPSLEVVLGRGDDGTALLLRWQHALADAPGMDLFLRVLDGEDPGAFVLRDEAGAFARRLRGGRGLPRRLAEVHGCALRHLLRSVPPPFQAPVDPRARRAAPSVTLSGEETAAAWARAGALGAELDRNGFLLGVSARAAVRAFAPAPWRTLRLPVPVNLRPPAWLGPVLSNWFAMVLLHLPVRRLRSLDEATATARAAWRAAIARGEDRATMALLRPAADLPGWLARPLLDGPRLRDGATLLTSFVRLGAVAGGTLLEAPVRDAVIGSSILPRPGLALVCAGWRDRLTVSAPGQAGASQDALLREATALLRGEVA